MIKKIISVLVALSLGVLMFVVPASAVSFGTTGDCSWTVVGTTLTISGNGKMGDYSYNSSNYASWSKNIRNVVIEDGVASVGNFAFFGCSDLQSVSIPNSVTSIGADAFCDCTGLTSITIPDSVISIGDGAFTNCTGLTSITIPNGVTQIGTMTFSRCTGLTSINIPDSVTSIGVQAFYQCTGLTNITITDSISTIDVYAFLETGYYNDESNWENGVLYIGNHLIYVKDDIVGAYDIKPGTKTIGAGSFENCSGLTSITIPDSVTSIGYYAFLASAGLTNVYYIGNEAQRANISIDYRNNELLNATWHYQCRFEKSNGILRYIADNEPQYMGVVEYEGDLYYINSTRQSVRNRTGYYVTKTNGLVPAGYYDFDENGVMTKTAGESVGVNLVKDPDGKIRYYDNGVAVYAGLVDDGAGNYYYIGSNLTAVTGKAYYITKTNGLLPAATYTFDEDGKIQISAIDNNLCADAEGNIRYIVDGEAQYAGVVQDSEGNYYYIGSGLTAVTGKNYYITKTNGLLPAATYTFDDDGKIQINTLGNNLYVDAEGIIRYVINGEAQYAGVVQDGDGNYYYINSARKAVKGTDYYIVKTNGILPEGLYTIDENGKIVID